MGVVFLLKEMCQWEVLSLPLPLSFSLSLSLSLSLCLSLSLSLSLSLPLPPFLSLYLSLSLCFSLSLSLSLPPFLYLSLSLSISLIWGAGCELSGTTQPGLPACQPAVMVSTTMVHGLTLWNCKTAIKCFLSWIGLVTVSLHSNRTVTKATSSCVFF